MQRRTLLAAALLVASVSIWAVATDGQAGTGTMGRGSLHYLGMWTAMTAAMMVSPLAWFASGYASAIRRHTADARARSARTVSLATGYAAVWVLAGIAALGVARLADVLATKWPAALPWAGGTALIVAGAYQLSPLKAHCLTRCRSPLSFALAASRLRGPFRDARVGALHGGWCLACCWQLMLALIAVGTMDLRWMTALAAVILVERAWSRSAPLVRVTGLALVVAGILAPWLPVVAPGLHSPGMS